MKRTFRIVYPTCSLQWPSHFQGRGNIKCHKGCHFLWHQLTAVRETQVSNYYEEVRILRHKTYPEPSHPDIHDQNQRTTDYNLCFHNLIVLHETLTELRNLAAGSSGIEWKWKVLTLQWSNAKSTEQKHEYMKRRTKGRLLYWYHL